MKGLERGFVFRPDPAPGALYALAVRPGDVVADVPEPQTLALLALGAMAVTRRRLKVEAYALF
jgi:hypothetical protein